MRGLCGEERIDRIDRAGEEDGMSSLAGGVTERSRRQSNGVSNLLRVAQGWPDGVAAFVLAPWFGSVRGPRRVPRLGECPNRLRRALLNLRLAPGGNPPRAPAPWV